MAFPLLPFTPYTSVSALVGIESPNCVLMAVVPVREFSHSHLFHKQKILYRPRSKFARLFLLPFSFLALACVNACIVYTQTFILFVVGHGCLFGLHSFPEFYKFVFLFLLLFSFLKFGRLIVQNDQISSPDIKS